MNNRYTGPCCGAAHDDGARAIAVMDTFSGRGAVVTGAARRIGRALTGRLFELEMNVGLTDRAIEAVREDCFCVLAAAGCYVSPALRAGSGQRRRRESGRLDRGEDAMGRLDGMVALITGAASGIGAACALRFAEEGAAIAGLDVQDGLGADYEAAVERAPRAHYAKADVRERAAVEAAVAELTERVGPPDILVNSAGVAGGGAVHLVSDADWDRVVDVNLKGTFIASRAVLPGMIERGSGNIVNIASIEGIEGFEGGSAYNASKGGVVILTKNMAIDYARRGVRVNAICPGILRTQMWEYLSDQVKAPGESLEQAWQRTVKSMIPLGRPQTPDDIGALAVYLAGAPNVTGQAINVDGGIELH